MLPKISEFHINRLIAMIIVVAPVAVFAHYQLNQNSGNALSLTKLLTWISHPIERSVSNAQTNVLRNDHDHKSTENADAELTPHEKDAQDNRRDARDKTAASCVPEEPEVRPIASGDTSNTQEKEQAPAIVQNPRSVPSATTDHDQPSLIYLASNHKPEPTPEEIIADDMTEPTPEPASFAAESNPKPQTDTVLVSTITPSKERLHQGIEQDGVVLPEINFQIGLNTVQILTKQRLGFLIARVKDKYSGKEMLYWLQPTPSIDTPLITTDISSSSLSQRYLQINHDTVGNEIIARWRNQLVFATENQDISVQYQLVFSERYAQYLVQEQTKTLHNNNIDLVRLLDEGKKVVMDARFIPEQIDQGALNLGIRVL